jgi:membrane-bound serine protease (ClpP class)
MLFEKESPEFRLAWQVLIPTLVVVSGFFIGIAGLVFKSQVTKPKTGTKGLVGEIGVVKKRLAPEGKVFVHGELWNAVSVEPVDVGEKVRVTRVENLVLEVQAIRSTV